MGGQGHSEELHPCLVEGVAPHNLLLAELLVIELPVCISFRQSQYIVYVHKYVLGLCRVGKCKGRCEVDGSSRPSQGGEFLRSCLVFGARWRECGVVRSHQVVEVNVGLLGDCVMDVL